MPPGRRWAIRPAGRYSSGSSTARGLAAPEGAEGRRARGRQAGRQAAHLRGRPRRPGPASHRARSLLDQDARDLQGGRRATDKGGLMSTHAAATSVRTSIVVDVPIERAFAVFTEDFGAFKPAEHNMLG